MRPKQWSKNLFLFAALIFTGNIAKPLLVLRAILGFLIFCVLSGAVYIINDILDKNNDLNHPLKCNRPIASGRLKIKYASLIAVIIIILALFISFLLPFEFRITSLAYLVLLTAYSLFLKKLIILDVIVVSLGFVLRLLAGGFAISIFSTSWSIILVFFLGVFISLVKRRAEKLTLGEKAILHRQNLKYYKNLTLNYFIIISANTVIISYVLFSFFSGKSPYLYLTIPFVLYGVYRYMFLNFEKNLGEEPAILFFKDKPLFYCIILWLIISIIILYKS